MRNATVINKRWVVINRKTGNARNSYTTRDVARDNKRGTERIFDTITNSFIR